MTTIIDKGYRATPEQIEHMAREVGRGQTAGITYLRCLIVAAQESKKRGVRAVDEAHERFYPSVLKGLDGNQRAATFARTSAATLRGYVKRGGKLADIDVTTATKRTLREFGAPPEPADRAERSAQRASGALVRALKRLARRDAALARRLAQAALEAVREVVPAGTRAERRAENRPAVH